MSYHRRPKDTSLPIAQLAALVALGLVFVPPLRLVAVGGLLLASGCFLGLLIYRVSTRPKASGVAQDTQLDSVCSPDTAFSSQAPGRTTIEELIRKLRSIDWFQFEKVVGVAYRKAGYHVTRRGGANPDGGIDLILEKDGQQTAVQCKQWKTWNVGVRAVREFLGALTDAGLQKGMFVTLNGYTGEARQLADKHGIEILNEAGLANLLASVDARYDPEILEVLEDTTKYCPKCERVMVLRTAEKGPNPGSKFWGCSAYPKCHYTMPQG